ncbi:MAG: ATP-dependent DNA helicase [Trueperella sp.]|nr:ATP-dependent DNA helicase [Trueperella sp.]
MELDSAQSAVLSAAAATSALSVIGAPGSGKTTVLKALVMQILQENPAAKIAVLSPDRRAASQLRNEISVQAGVLREGVEVSSIAAFAYAIISQFAQATGRRAPELLSGPEQDAMLGEMFDLFGADLFDDGAAHSLLAFRAEYRDLITRAAELQLSSRQLAELGEKYNQAVWVTGARVMEIYEKALATEATAQYANPDRTDHARIVTQAAAALRNWDTATEGKLDGIIGIEHPHWDWVLVDDVQNATLAVQALLAEVLSSGGRVVTFGDPDVAVQGFRGGISHLPAILTRPLGSGGIGAKRCYLAKRYRGGGALGELVQRVTQAIHTAGAGEHRSAQFQAVEPAGGFQVSITAFANDSEEIEYLASYFRDLHLNRQIPYREMAVITRSHVMHQQLRRALLRYGVPVAPIVLQDPLRTQRAVAGLIALIELALADAAQVNAAAVVEVITGPLVRIDPLRLQQLQRELQGWELKAGRSRTRDQILLDILGGPYADSTVGQVPELATVAKLIAKIRAQRSAPAPDILWVAWDGLGIAEHWRDLALTAGMVGDGAEADLDAIIQLFRVAQRLAERDPQNANFANLVEFLVQQDLPEDSIARSGAQGDRVTLTTPSAAVGQSWDHVVVMGLNEGEWPNTRLRNPLTKVPELVATLVGSMLAGQEQSPQQLRQDVIDDELRILLQAITRARHSVVLTCLDTEDTGPSRFLGYILASGKFGELEKPNVAHLPGSTADLSNLIGQLRRGIAAGGELAAGARQTLSALVAAGIWQADPDNWVDQLPLSTTAPLPSQSVSPSKIEGFLKCAMRAFLQQIGAQDSSDQHSAAMGTIVHRIAQEFGFDANPDREAMQARFDELWQQEDFPAEYQIQLLYARGKEAIAKLAGFLAKAGAATALEANAQGQIGEVSIRAQIDRLEVGAASNPSHHTAGNNSAAIAEPVAVVDFKTSKNAIKQSESEQNPQLLTYQWLVANGKISGPDGRPITGVTPAGAKLVYLATATSGISVREQEALTTGNAQLAVQMVNRAAELQRGPSMPAAANDFCRFCSYQSICPAQKGERLFS